MLNYHSVKAVEGVRIFLVYSMKALVVEVEQGIYHDLYGAVKTELDRLESVPQWISEQTATSESYRSAVSDGFAEIGVMSGFFTVLREFYKKLLYLCDPEGLEPVKVVDVWMKLVDDVVNGMLAFAVSGPDRLVAGANVSASASVASIDVDELCQIIAGSDEF